MPVVAVEHDVPNQQAARGARLVILSDSCYSGQWCDALRESGDTDIAVQGASVSDSTAGDMGWEGARFTKELSLIHI